MVSDELWYLMISDGFEALHAEVRVENDAEASLSEVAP